MGIDLAGPAIEYATVEASKRGLENRLSFIEGDVRQVHYRDEFAHVDLLTSFMMGHDFWPRDNCVVRLQRLQKTFPKVRRFFFGRYDRILMNNPQSKYAVAKDNVPIFTLGFEFGHTMMGVYLPTMEEWDGVFPEGGWRCVRRHLIETQSLSVVFELDHV